ncbi:MAG: hypothetical protein ABJO75_00620, partial [Sedimentitalea sp.]
MLLLGDLVSAISVELVRHLQHPERKRPHRYQRWGDPCNKTNQRSHVETQIGRWKQVIGDRLQARDFDNQIAEAQIASKALNRTTALG